MIYVYAVVPDGTPVPALAGIHGVPVQEIPVVAGFSALVTRHRDEPPAPNAEAVWQHEAVVEAVLARAVPLRFGTCFTDEDGLRLAFAASAETLAGATARLQGQVEVSVRLLGPAASAARPRPAQISGRAWLGELAGREQREAAARAAAMAGARSVHVQVAARATDGLVREHPAGAVLLTCAYLLPGGDVTAFVDELAAASSGAGVRPLCTGPWPAYSFAAVDAAAGRAP